MQILHGLHQGVASHRSSVTSMGTCGPMYKRSGEAVPARGSGAGACGAGLESTLVVTWRHESEEEKKQENNIITIKT